MNRRGFLGMLGAAMAGATLDPERLLWVPGKKLISIPAQSSDFVMSMTDYTSLAVDVMDRLLYGFYSANTIKGLAFQVDVAAARIVAREIHA